MALKLVIVVLINAVIANEPAPNNGEIPVLLSSADSSLRNHEEIILNKNQVPKSHYENVIELLKEEPTTCHSTTVLIPMLNQLINELIDEPSNASKVSRISILLKEYLKNMTDNAHTNENMKLLNEDTLDKDTLRTGYYGTPKGHVKTKIVFKYDLPSINQPQCKDVFMRLIKTAYDAYILLAKNPTCQNANIVEELLKKSYEMPYNIDSGLNLSPNNKIPDTKGEYAIYDSLKSKTEMNYGYYQEPSGPNNPNIYKKFIPAYPNVDFNLGYLEPKTNILNNFIDGKITPNLYEFNAFEYGNNPNIPSDLNLYKPGSYPTENLQYDGNPNIYNIYDTKKDLVPQKNNNNLYPQNFNLNLDNLKIPENIWNMLVDNPIDHTNGNQNPLESYVSILATAKPPEDKRGINFNPQLKYQTYPSTNENVQNQNIQYPYQSPNNLLYQYKIPGEYTNPENPYQKESQYVSNLHGIPNMNSHSYQQNVYNNYLNKLTVLPNLQQSNGVSNAFKLDPSSANIIELTFILKRAAPLIYQPLYFVKFRIPYSTYLENIKKLLIAKPHLKMDPLKLYQDLIALSNVSDISPGLRGYKKEDILRLAYKNGELVTAKLVKDDDALNKQLNLVQRLNSDFGATDILKLTSKNNVLLKPNVDKGNTSDVRVGITEYGQANTPYYDFGSAGLGFNNAPMQVLGSKKFNVQPIGYTSFGNAVVRPQPYFNTLDNKKSSYGTFTLGLQG